MAWATDPARAKSVEADKAYIIAAKTGPLTWWKPDRGYRDDKGEFHYPGPRGLGLTPTLVAEAEAELDGYRSFAPGEVENCPNTFSEGLRLIAIAASRRGAAVQLN